MYSIQFVCLAFELRKQKFERKTEDIFGECKLNIFDEYRNLRNMNSHINISQHKLYVPSNVDMRRNIPIALSGNVPLGAVMSVMEKRRKTSLN